MKTIYQRAHTISSCCQIFLLSLTLTICALITNTAKLKKLVCVKQIFLLRVVVSMSIFCKILLYSHLTPSYNEVYMCSPGHSENTSSEADLTTTTPQTTPPVANNNKITDSVELAEEVDEESSSYLLGNQGAESNMLHSYAVLSLTPSQLVNSKSDRENEN